MKGWSAAARAASHSSPYFPSQINGHSIIKIGCFVSSLCCLGASVTKWSCSLARPSTPSPTIAAWLRVTSLLFSQFCLPRFPFLLLHILLRLSVAIVVPYPPVSSRSVPHLNYSYGRELSAPDLTPLPPQRRFSQTRKKKRNKKRNERKIPPEEIRSKLTKSICPLRVAA